MGIFMPFLVLIFIVNPTLRAMGCALQPWELIFIFAVGYVSMSINELLGRVLATYAVMHYMATPENLWEEYVFGLVQPYLVVEDAEEQLAWFYEGLPRNATIPWAIWIRPHILVAELYRCAWPGISRIGNDLAPAMGRARAVAISLCTSRRRIGRNSGAKRISRIYETAAILGLAFPFPQLSSCGTSSATSIPASRDYPGDSELHDLIGRYVPFLHGRLNFLIIGFAYFTDLQVLFSIWVFWIFTWLQIGMTNRLGLAEGLGEFAGTRQQALGGFIVFCLWGLWIARHHLKAVFQQAFRQTKNMDDRNELMSYRTAVTTFLACALFIMFWLFKGGMTPFWAVLVAVFWFVFYTGFAKIVAMTGLVFLESPSSLGTGIMGFAPPDSLSSNTLPCGNKWAACIKMAKVLPCPLPPMPRD